MNEKIEEDDVALAQGSNKYLVDFTRGQLWTIIGLKWLLYFGQTKDQAKDFIT